MKTFNLSEIGTVARGKQATEKRVAIAENGQMRFNSLASEVFKQHSPDHDPSKVHVYFLLDDDNNLVIDVNPFTRKNTKGLEKDYTKENGKILSFNKESAEKGEHLYYISLAGMLTHAGYDYKASGTQTFTLFQYDPKIPSRLAFKLPPEGKLEKRQVIPRKRKEKAPQIEQAMEPELVEA
jgi:hypothetical protein